MSDWISVDLDTVRDKLTERFIDYFYRLENPIPSKTETQHIKKIQCAYDPIFRNKVEFMVHGVLNVIISSEPSQDPPGFEGTSEALDKLRIRE